MKKILFILLATFLMSCGTYQVTVRPNGNHQWHTTTYITPYNYYWLNPKPVFYTNHNHGHHHHGHKKTHIKKNYGHRK
jgi:hypothetical protein